jgi:geranylgeranyl diphosphate synthase type II
MQSFQDLSNQFTKYFNVRHFPKDPASLYDANEYFLSLGGKRVRPVMCLMGNELFDEISKDAWPVAAAIELFHNFTLIHDDIMDKAPLRRNQPTVHAKYGESTALLSGDVMLIVAYDYLNKVSNDYLHHVIRLFNTTAKEVCEGQQMDMDFEKQEVVHMDEYIRMIELKTSVLLAASLRLGAILGGAGQANQEHIYAFGRDLGIAFQIQDDYLDAYGDPAKFGKQPGGDIMSNKKTFLMIKALESANPVQLKELKRLMQENPEDKVARVLSVFDDCGVNKWAAGLKEKYITEAFEHLEEMAVLTSRKDPLRELAHFLVQREH